MIQPNELRIGNWVYTNKIFPHQVESLDERGINLDVSYGEYGCIEYDGYFDDGLFYKSDLRPIPLTPNILEKCGFKEMIDNETEIGISVFVNGNYDIERFATDSEEWEFYQNDDEYVAYIKSLHQLQNLYFALTGKELEFKP